MTVNKIVFFQGNTQYRNTGDVLINKSLLDLLRIHARVIVNDEKMPASYVAGLGLGDDEKITGKRTSFYRLLLRYVVQKRGSKIYLIAGPPGHLFGNSWKRVMKNFVSTLFLAFMKIGGVTVIKIGFSIGPFGKALAISEMIRAKFTDHYLVRDSMSLALAQQIGIRKARPFPDLAWHFLSGRKPSADGFKNTVLISFRDAVYTGNESETYHNKLKECLVAMLRTFEPATKIEVVYQVAMDFNFCKKIYEELKHEFNVSFNDQQVNLQTAEVTYEKGTCIITNRLHAALLAYKYGALPIILTDTGKHLKITGIFADAEISELLLNTGDSPEINARKFNHLLSSREELYAKIEAAEKQYIAISEDILNQVFN